MRRDAIIFGGGGQDGLFLRDLLSSSGYDVLSFARPGGANGPFLDVSEFDQVENVIRDRRPDVVFHLAARSSTSHEVVLDNHRAIVDGALAVIESVDRHAPGTRVFLASSALVFRNVGRPITEEDELVTDTAYAMARAEALQIARYYRERGRKVFVGFLFHHESPFRPPHSLARRIAAGVVEIYRGRQNSLSIGSPSVTKEWTWAGDTVEAIVRLVNQDEIFEACIGSGIGKTIRDYASACCEVLGVSLYEHLVEVPGFKVEYPLLVSGSSKIRSLGWVPKIDLFSLAFRMVNAELSGVRSAKVFEVM